MKDPVSIAPFINEEYSNLPWEEVEKHYYESHRYFHNFDHIENLLNKIQFSITNLNIKNKDIQAILYLSVIYHDIIYDPTRSDNEKKSAELFKKFVKKDVSHKIKNYVENIILDTITHKTTEVFNEYFDIPYEQISNIVLKADMDTLNFNLLNLIKHEEQIFKEYQFINWVDYKKKSIEFHKENCPNKEIVEYIENKIPKIGIYAGSFNPFHKGHMNILEKAEKFFDKVIVVKAVNPSKNFDKNKYENELRKLNELLKYREVVGHKGLITDLIKYEENNGSDITLVRGLRNGYDLDAENKYVFYLKKIYPKIKIMYVPCDKEFEYYNSSSIRELKKLNVNIKEFLP